MLLPSLVVHADWGKNPKKRWFAGASLQPDGIYIACPPKPVDDLSDFLPGLKRKTGEEGAILVGFDFPIGLPLEYARLARIYDFLAALARFGQGEWSDFYEVAREPHEIGLLRPFYPHRPGGTRRGQLVERLGLSSFDGLRRRCEYKQENRRAACPLFWTLGAHQVGKAAIVGWRDLLAPGLRDPGLNLAIWPFSGKMVDLIRPARMIVAETYPAEFYSHLNIDVKRRAFSKRSQESRASTAPRLQEWARSAAVDLHYDLRTGIESGFGSGANGEDLFDSVVGLFGMLYVVLGKREPGELPDSLQRSTEGWIFGQDICPNCDSPG